ncbi:phenylacetate--CoA ligase family protein [Rhizobium sp. AG207R]|uniref:phenylacetate--CoA ligase family protein n=1 Tax=Rhizobium sp. AG207R TaxID=2802287 RepID=UPI0022AC47CF|nr:phenylacetate--CoA ligase family protein [Rhizobium sp. AG207R]MCZ3376237.1 phenylacetate--CoA ligase family protein [Rhizobium sp. AG207R]
MILSALRNGIRGALATIIVYPLTERYEARDIRSKTRWIREEIDRPFSERRARAVARLAETVAFAGVKVPYYRDLFSSIGFDPAKVAADPRYIEDLPYLTKDIIREQGQRLLREDRDGIRIHVAKTGGSTGPSAHIHYDQEAADWSSAITQESRRRIGNTHWRSELHFASKFPEVFPWRDRMREHVKCFAMNRDNIFFATFASEELEQIWRRIKSIRPHLAHAHPSTADQLAAHVETTRGKDKGFQIFESSGELLEARQRERIERVLQCQVIDRYGLAEAGVIAYQIDPKSSDMRFYEFFAWPELRTEEETGLTDIPEGARSGELVITPLFNRMMPLLRYRTGDNAILAHQPNGIVIPRMVGRVHDVIMLGGTPLPTHFIQDVLDRVGGIREFQIQMLRGKPVFRLVPEDTADTNAIRERIASWWSDNVEVEFITPADLKLVGLRQKFRHFVPEEAPGQ